MHDVFISYSTKQKEIADAMCHYLEENKIRCWIAPRDIAAGEEYAEVIVKAIKDCKVFVIIFSKYSADSVWCKSETNKAVGSNKIIIPFKVDNTELQGGMSLYLESRHWIDAVPAPEKCFKELLPTIKRVIGLGSNNSREPVSQQERERQDSNKSESCYPKKGLRATGAEKCHNFCNGTDNNKTGFASFSLEPIESKKNISTTSGELKSVSCPKCKAVFVSCPKCKTENRISKSFLGLHIKCINCKNSFSTKPLISKKNTTVSVLCSDCKAENNISGAILNMFTKAFSTSTKSSIVSVLCSHCKAENRISKSYLGLYIRCSHCQNVFSTKMK